MRCIRPIQSQRGWQGCWQDVDKGKYSWMPCGECADFPFPPFRVDYGTAQMVWSAFILLLFPLSNSKDIGKLLQFGTCDRWFPYCPLIGWYFTGGFRAGSRRKRETVKSRWYEAPWLYYPCKVPSEERPKKRLQWDQAESIIIDIDSKKFPDSIWTLPSSELYRPWQPILLILLALAHVKWGIYISLRQCPIFSEIHPISAGTSPLPTAWHIKDVIDDIEKCHNGHWPMLSPQSCGISIRS